MRVIPSLFFFAMSSLTDVEWSERRPMPVAQAGGAAALLNGDLVIAGGTTWVDGVKTWLPDVQIYNPASNSWKSGPNLPMPLANGAFAASATELEIFGGGDGKTARRESWKLDSARTAWVRTGSTPEPTLLGKAARVGEAVFLFGGCEDIVDLKTCSDAVWSRGRKGEWQRVSRIPAGVVALPAIAVSGSSVYLFGGCSIDADGKVMNHSQLLRYDTASNRWKAMRDLPARNRGLSAVAFGERSILLFGGYTDKGFSSEVFLYDTASDTYRKLKPMPLSLMGAEFVRNGNTIYGAGGEDRMRSRSAKLLQGTLTVTVP